MAQQYDLGIIGAGPGGYVAALIASGLCAKVALVERDGLGGACLHRGCIPTKSLYHSSRIQESFCTATQRKDSVIGELERQVDRLVHNGNVDVYSGNAQLNSRTEIAVSGNESIYAGKVIIATGSTPIMPSALDIDRGRIMTSDEIVRLRELPQSILVLGGGYIGCEYANLFANYGVKVNLVELLDDILTTEDRDVVGEVLKSFGRKSIEIYTGTKLESLEKTERKVASHLSNGGVLETDIVLVAVGRSPNSKGLGLEKLGIKLSDNGAIEVDNAMRTNLAGIYAIGDVISRKYRLAHVAQKEAEIAVRNALGERVLMGYNVIPSAIFVEPEVASVGKREFELKKDGAQYVVGRFSFKGNAMAHCTGDTGGFVKLIFDREIHQLLGGAIVGSEASELISMLVSEMHLEATADSLVAEIFFHPSRAEAIRHAAENALRQFTS